MKGVTTVFRWSRFPNRCYRDFLIVVVSGVLAGCAGISLPRLQRDVPVAWRNAPSNEQAASPLAPDLEHWWRVFSDPGLEYFIKEALQNNLTLQQAVYRLKSARAMRRYASARFKPALSFRAGPASYPPGDASYFEAGFDAEWELGFFGQRENTLREAQSRVSLAASKIQAARVSVVSEIARTYIELRTAQHKAVLLNEIVRSQKTMLNLVKKRRTLGLASVADVSRSESDYAKGMISVEKARETRENTLQQLAVLLGREEPEVAWRSGGPLPMIGLYHIETEPAELLRSRPGIQQAEQHVLLAASQLGLARADMYPKFVLGGTIGLTTRVDGRSPGNSTHSLSIGPLIDIPLFDWGARKAVVNARNAALSASLLAYRQAILEGISDVESALITLQYRQAEVRHTQQSVDALTRSEAATKTLRDLRLADRYDWAAAHMSANVARLDLGEARYAESVALISLYKALGGAPPLSDKLQR